MYHLDGVCVRAILESDMMAVVRILRTVLMESVCILQVSDQSFHWEQQLLTHFTSAWNMATQTCRENSTRHMRLQSSTFTLT